MKKYLLILCLFLLTFFHHLAFANTQQLLQLLDYVGVDYAGTVADGKITDAGEYEEMLEFTAGINEHIKNLPEHPIKSELLSLNQDLLAAIEQKRPPQTVRDLTVKMHKKIIAAYKIVVIPRKQPDLQLAQKLYAEHCASCHGVDGFGDGPAAVNMDPPPINFRDVERYRQRTLYGLYTTITQGVSNTAMNAYSDTLNSHERWSLAFYVGSMAASVDDDIHYKKHPLLDIKKLTITTPASAADLYGESGARVMGYLRQHPQLLYNREQTIDFIKDKLERLLAAYQYKQYQQAYQFAVEAYLEGFELIEPNITAFDPQLKTDIETAMTALRNKIRSGITYEEIQGDVKAINNKLNLAENILHNRSLNGAPAFAGSLFILLREGLEAILIIAALVAFLIKTNRRDGLKYIHAGWILALLAGGLTWWASLSLFNISGASREITEGVAAIVAMVVLLYVGFWMHDKSSAEKWKKFIDDNMNKALGSGTLWALTGLSFIAVYREAFETILFYQAMWVQTDDGGRAMVIAGMLVASLLLLIVGWLIMKYSFKLPLRQFFSVTAGLMFVLAIIFAGKGVAALQEAGVLSSSPVNFIHIDLLGIYPNLQGLVLQLILIVVAVYLWKFKGNHTLTVAKD